MVGPSPGYLMSFRACVTEVPFALFKDLGYTHSLCCCIFLAQAMNERLILPLYKVVLALCSIPTPFLFSLSLEVMLHPLQQVAQSKAVISLFSPRVPTLSSIVIGFKFRVCEILEALTQGPQPNAYFDAKARCTSSVSESNSISAGLTYRDQRVARRRRHLGSVWQSLVKLC